MKSGAAQTTESDISHKLHIQCWPKPNTLFYSNLGRTQWLREMHTYATAISKNKHPEHRFPSHQSFLNIGIPMSPRDLHSSSAGRKLLSEAMHDPDQTSFGIPLKID